MVHLAGSRGRRQPGGMLSGGSLTAALDAERIFRLGSFDKSKIKGAGYELRLADDWGAIPAGPGSKESLIATPGSGINLGEIRLRPGDTAIVASKERFCLDFDVSTSIGAKFRWAAQGLQMLHGSTAHPGYGRTLTTSGWEKKRDERLYLIVINIGPDVVTLHPGDPLVYVQFFEVEREVPVKDIQNVGFENLTERFLSRDESVGMFFNPKNAEVSRKVDRLTEKMSKRVEFIHNLVERTGRSTELVVVLGVFLVTITIFGVVYESLVEGLSKIQSDTSPDQLDLFRWLTISFASVCGLVLILTLAAIVRLAILPRKRAGKDTYEPPVWTAHPESGPVRHD